MERSKNRCRVSILYLRWLIFLSACGLLAVSAVSGCQGKQSALEPASDEAAAIANLFYWMTGAGVLIWLVVISLAIYLILLAPRRHDEGQSKWLIIGGGVVLPTVLLTVLLLFGLPLLPQLVAKATADALVVNVDGLQWWWRVKYPGAIASGDSVEDDRVKPVETANEIYLPVGQPVQFYLHSDDVIHSFWIPSLGGKIDMLPGRQTRLRLTPTRVGVFRGACAEYCGASHALMNFDVVVVEPADFEQWLSDQRLPAIEPLGEVAVRGERLFQTHGCGGCHTIRGTAANGGVGPDLTHVGSRQSLAAGAMPNTHDDYVRWITDAKAVKPEALMPHFRTLPPEEIEAIATYLEQLK